LVVEYSPLRMPAVLIIYALFHRFVRSQFMGTNCQDKQTVSVSVQPLGKEANRIQSHGIQRSLGELLIRSIVCMWLGIDIYTDILVRTRISNKFCLYWHCNFLFNGNWHTTRADRIGQLQMRTFNITIKCDYLGLLAGISADQSAEFPACQLQWRPHEISENSVEVCLLN